MTKLLLTVTMAVLTAVLTGCTTVSSMGEATLAVVATPTPVPAGIGIRQVHSPGIVDIDETFAPGECHVVTQSAVSGDILPDPLCTPGAVDPAVTQADLASTICMSGYTKTVRPPASNTNAFKVQVLAAYNEPYARTIELDHLVPLELGGANSASNLWPEPNRTDATSFNNPKDAIEAQLRAAVCSGTISLVAAQDAIASDWVSAKKVLGL